MMRRRPFARSPRTLTSRSNRSADAAEPATCSSCGSISPHAAPVFSSARRCCWRLWRSTVRVARSARSSDSSVSMEISSAAQNVPDCRGAGSRDGCVCRGIRITASASCSTAARLRDMPAWYRDVASLIACAPSLRVSGRKQAHAGRQDRQAETHQLHHVCVHDVVVIQLDELSLHAVQPVTQVCVGRPQKGESVLSKIENGPAERTVEQHVAHVVGKRGWVEAEECLLIFPRDSRRGGHLCWMRTLRAVRVRPRSARRLDAPR